LSIGAEGEAAIGTLGYFVVDEAGQVYLLSLAGVLGSKLNDDAILQPGPVDGRKPAEDEVAHLSNALTLQGPVPAAHMINLARLAPDIGVETAIPEIGPVLGVRAPEVGMTVRKVGRTTGLTSGQITAIGQEIELGLGDGTGQLQGAIRAELEFSAGDEGALVVDDEGYAVGVLIGSSPQATILAPMQAVLDIFDVRLPPQTVTAPDGATMIFIPPGPFDMGSESGESGEKPVHTVTLDAFYIDQYEVTNAQYVTFLNKQGNHMEEGVTWLDAGDTDARIHQNGDVWQADEGFTNHPVVEVSWYGARAYCEWRGARLPTEAEWEKAARGTEGRLYPWPWGDTFEGTRTNFCDKNCSESWADSEYGDGYAGTAPVGSYSNGVSPYDVYDMAGNVWEWVNDGYDAEYYANSPTENPTGSQNKSSKVLRGGSWYNDADDVRAAYRIGDGPGRSDDDIGFRCAGGGEAGPGP
jgi:formylglycine-generating enzyme required for sulfatase activity